MDSTNEINSNAYIEYLKIKERGLINLLKPFAEVIERAEQMTDDAEIAVWVKNFIKACDLLCLPHNHFLLVHDRIKHHLEKNLTSENG